MIADHRPPADAAIQTDTRAGRRLEHFDGAGRGPEVVFRNFRVDTALDGMTCPPKVRLIVSQLFSRCDTHLLAHQIQAGRHFRDWMFDLQSGVHFKKVKSARRIKEELHRSRATISHGQCPGHGRCSHLLP